MRYIIVLFLFISSMYAASLSHSVYKVLNKIQEHNGKKEYKISLNLINEALKGDPSAINKAYLYQSRGYVYIAKNQYDKALKDFELVIQQQAMKESTLSSLRFNMAQLSLNMKKYDQAITYMNAYLKQTKKPKSEAYLIIAHAYNLKKDLQSSLSYTKKAITRQKSLKKNVPTSWYELEFSNNYGLKKYVSAIKTLKILLDQHPKKKQYWIYTAQMYTLNKQPKEALAYFEQAYHLGLFKSDEIVQFTYFLSRNGLYYKAAQLLENHINAKSMKANEKHLKLLFELQFNAKEYTSAVTTLQQLYKLNNKREYLLKEARVYNLMHKHEKAAQYYEKALNGANTKEYADAYMELAYLYYELKDIKGCKKCLKEAQKYKKTKKRAKVFLGQLSTGS